MIEQHVYGINPWQIYTDKSGTIDEVLFCLCKFPIKLWIGEGSFKGVKMIWSLFNFKSPLGSLTEEYGMTVYIQMLITKFLYLTKTSINFIYLDFFCCSRCKNRIRNFQPMAENFWTNQAHPKIVVLIKTSVPHRISQSVQRITIIARLSHRQMAQISTGTNRRFHQVVRRGRNAHTS